MPEPTEVFAAAMPVESRVEHKHGVFRGMVWTYLALLIFEGSLRKWIFPQLSAPLLVVRDPVALLIYGWALWAGVFPKRPLLTVGLVIGLLSLAVSLFIRQGRLLVTFYGFHADFFHLPLIFLMGNLLHRSDVKNILRVVLILAVPTAILMTLQFAASPDSPLNRGTLGAESGQIESALGRIRPAAFFSYNTGAGQYLAFLTAATLAGLLTKEFPVWLVYTGGVSLGIATAVSGSRTTVSAIIIVALSVGIIAIVRPRSVGRLPIVMAGAFIIGAIVYRFAVFHEGMEVLQARTAEAFASDPLWDRLMYTFLPAVRAPLLGFGLGVGTNVGSSVLTREFTFLLAEGEWPRILLESGPILGGAFIIWRLTLIGSLVGRAFASIKLGNFLPCLLTAATAPMLLNGNFGQPTALGFAVFGAGMCLASQNDVAPTEPPSDSSPELVERPPRRGRSAYADRLHGS